MKFQSLSNEHELFALPIRLGGLNIQDPTKHAAGSYETSLNATEKLKSSIQSGQQLNIFDHITTLKSVRKQAKLNSDLLTEAQSERILLLLPEIQRSPLKRIISGKASQWLTIIPTAADHMDLSPDQFRDALAIRYGLTIRNLPVQCDGCESPMNLTHAMICKKGGLIKHGHDQHRDHCAAIANMAWNGVEIEPILREADPTNNVPALRADFRVNGIWEAERAAFFDNRLICADAPSYANQDWKTISRNHAVQKHTKYDRAAEDIRGSFTPLICSTDGVPHKEYEAFQRKTSEVLAAKWM